MKYRTKLRAAFIATSVVVNVLSLAFLYRVSHAYLLAEFRQKVLSITTTTATLIDGDLHKQIKAAEDEFKQPYITIRDQLRRVRDENRQNGTFVKYIYTLERIPGTKGSLRYVVDPEEDPKEHAPVGEFFPYPGEKLFVEDGYVDEEFFTDHTGSWLSAYGPIKDSAGRLVAIVEVDIAADHVLADLRPILWASLGSIAVSLLLALGMTFWLSGRVARPLMSLRATLEKIGKGDLSVRSDIRNNDEFGEVSNTINQMVDGLRERETVKTAFARYVSQQVMDNIIQSGAVPAVHGDRRKITALFSDIRGFSTISETMRPEAVVDILNQYFARMVDVIFRNKGTLDKFMGDGLMVIFGAPTEDLDQEEHAIQAAIEMQQELKKLCAKWVQEGKPNIRIGIGINSGTAIVGNIGSEERMEYTAIGDTVNLAARLEGATKETGTDILISESTYNSVRGIFAGTRVGSIQVKGRTEPVTVYSIDVPSLAE